MATPAKSTSTVCVTGAEGFLASWLVKLLLSSGSYTVRGTVSDPSGSKNAHLIELEGAGERLRLVKADVLDYSSVAAAVAGYIIAPAVTDTVNVLKACYEAKVKRVVVVSSFSAVCFNPNLPSTEIAGQMRSTAERIRSVNPSIDGETVENRIKNLVDVRDVADALLLAYENPEASGRYICSSTPVRVSDLVSILKTSYPTYNYPKSFVEAEANFTCNTEKLQKLGWSFRPMEETLRDSVVCY
ncbi:hypothetical protein BAE44_0020913 [Dichanthelium oligosanthes]|uniref:NAD(P)-binding domain-containing protein n=1 Tax=Dichanthelium oligosanthes TaxID=888268 RepID=A0A1E5UZ14_9POAL|nr:hypothetical protein BAE44_0020913 [Dichanthelium oligosanthes]